MSTSKHTLFSMIYKGLLSAVNFANSVLLARTLTPADRVELQYSASLAQTGMTYVGGYTNYYGYALPKYPEETRNIVQMGNLLMFALSLVVWGVTLVLALVPLPWVHLTRPWLWALGCLPLTFIFGYGSRILNAIQEISWLNRANMAQPLLYAVFLGALFLVHRRWPEPTVVTAAYVFWVASFALSVLFTMAVAYRTLGVPGVTKLRFHRRHWQGTLRYGGWSSLAQAVNIANARMDFWLVMGLLKPGEASVYGIAVVASEVLLNVSSSIATVVFRRMTGGTRDDAIRITELSCRHTILSSAIVALGMYAAFPWLIRVAYGPTYAAAVWPFLILLPGLVIKAASNIVIQYATNSLGQPKTAIWMNGVSAIIDAVCCLLFIPALGMNGAALASTTAYVLSFALYVLWYGRVTGRNPRYLVAIQKSDLLPYLQMLREVYRRLRRSR
jgi:O-antigen/teichoic acid export membrane protein